MKYILQVSDFHLTENRDGIEKLYELADFIVASNYEVENLVHTGDFIDSKYICEKIGKAIIDKYNTEFTKDYVYDEKTFETEIRLANNKNNAIITEYNKLLKQESKNAFNIAQEVFSNFTNKLGVAMKDVVICCGNHDKIRLIDINDEKSSCTTDHYTPTKFDKKRFELFNQFCENLGLNYNCNNNIISSKDKKFFILNTNYLIWHKYKGNCINCKELDEFTSKNTFDNRNIIVAHKPCHELCENYILPYIEETHIANFEKLKKFSTTYLCGDKHTVSEASYSGMDMFLCGAPLSSKKELIYNLLHYNEESNNYQCEYVCYKNGNWFFGPTDTDCNKVLDISKEFIDQTTKDFISELSIDSYKNFEKSDIASDMFKLMSKLKYRGQYISKWSNDVKIFEQFYDIISKNNNLMNPVNIRGENGTGKSCFLGIEYFYLLDLFKKGIFRYIPVYFNIDNINVSIQAKTSIKNKFDSFINKCNTMSNRLNLPLLYIIDGLDDSDFIDDSTNSIEKIIYKKLCSEHSKYILSFNRYRFSNFNSSINFDSEADNSIIYFNPIDIMSVDDSNNEFNLFIDTYLSLRGIENTNDIEKIKNLIKKYKKININLNFLHYNFNFFNNNKNFDDTSWDVLKKYRIFLSNYCKNMTEYEYEDTLPKAAYLLSYEGNTFSDLVNKKLIFDYRVFKILKKYNDIRTFLISYYYFQQIIYYGEMDNDKKIEKNDIFYKFIPRDLGIMIRLQLEEMGNPIKNLKKICCHLDDITISMPLYLICNMTSLQNVQKKGFINYCLNFSNFSFFSKKSNEEKNEKFEDKEKVETTENGDYKYFPLDKIENEEDFKRYSSIRTLMICQSICDYSKKTNELIHFLIVNNNFRIFNRIYQLLYYGDLTINGEDDLRIVTPNMDVIHKGFDFHNCFHALISKLEYYFKLNKRYHLMEFDLFTICDIVYSRIQNPISTVNENDFETFFYYKDYNNNDCHLAECVLNKVIRVIDIYIENKNKYNFELKKTDSIYIYLSTMRNKFEEFKNMLSLSREDNTIKTKMEEYTYPDYELNNILQLKNINRIGWNIKSTNEKISKERCVNLSQDIKYRKETILDHIFESMCIALLYLPTHLCKHDISDSLSDTDFSDFKKKYNKGKVLNYIFVHEFGKCKIKDYTPDSSKYGELNNSRIHDLLSLFNLGAIDNFGGLDNYFEIFEAEIETKNSDINLRIAQDICYVQREYKLESLLLADKDMFDKDRLEDFQNSTRITTNIGYSILRMLVKDNPKFKKE